MFSSGGCLPAKEMTTQNKSVNRLPLAFLAALRHLLRPLVRLLLAHGISYQVFSELVRSAYVKVVEEDFRLADKPQTDSRISLLTGLHRREVSRLRRETGSAINLPQHASIGAQVLAIWSGHPEYVDRDGVPISLPRLAGKSGHRSFESLVQSVSKDFRPRVVLDEWIRQGVVSLDDSDRVHLRADAFVSPHDIEEKLYYFGQNIHDHLAATVHNLIEGSPPFLERCVFYDKLTAESVNELADYSRSVGMRALHAVNKRAAELQQHDNGLPTAFYRTNFGIYYFSEAENSDEVPAP